MNPVVLDSSALLALMLKERGAEVVAQHLEGAVISAVNLGEVGAKMADRGSSLDLIEEEVRAAEIRVMAFDEELANASSRLRDPTRAWGLSLGDRACLALGIASNCPVITSDRVWAEIGLPVEIILFR